VTCGRSVVFSGYSDYYMNYICIIASVINIILMYHVHLWLICWFMVFNATFYNISLISWRYWWRKPEYPEKTTDLPQVTDKLYHLMLYRVHLNWVGFDHTTLVVISTDCTGSCTMLPVSLDCPFLIAPLVFSNIYER
jgi:hypothetical protein